MIWAGVLALFAGAIATFAVDDKVGGVALGTVGVVAMIFGAALLVAGVVRLNRARSTVSSVPDRLYRTSKGKIAAMIAVGVYILSPLDIVPDVFLPVGIIDDATAFTWLVFAIGQEISRHREKSRAVH
jgi:hypothetical protein